MYDKVPNMISTKDLSYLEDIFSWNYGAYKASVNMEYEIGSEELCNCIRKASDLFLNNMKNVLAILEDGGSCE